MCRSTTIYSTNVLLSSQIPSNVCTSIYHENMSLALSVINNHVAEIPSYSKDSSASCLVDRDNDKCWFGKCSHDGCGFQAMYALPYAFEGEKAKWMQWQEHGGRISKLEMHSTVKDSYIHISMMSTNFSHHCHMKWRQAKSYQSDKELVSNKYSETLVLQIDFAKH